MAQFYVNSDDTEDTFAAADNVEDAIRIAREVARNSPTGERICIEYKGMHIWQFVLMPDGKVTETKLQAA